MSIFLSGKPHGSIVCVTDILFQVSDGSPVVEPIWVAKLVDKVTLLPAPLASDNNSTTISDSLQGSPSSATQDVLLFRPGHCKEYRALVVYFLQHVQLRI
jgi:hypothetical protein